MKGLSILIPVHEYNPTTLVTTLHKQCASLGIPFEIIVFDDASSFESYSSWKPSAEQIANLHIYRVDNNIGRAGIRNELIKKASYEWLLFLDVDTIPCEENYLQTYLPFLTTVNTCICGGTAYKKNIPAPDKHLRWAYGIAREELSAATRNQNPFDTFTLNNLLIRKEVLYKFPLDDSIQKYGHEDTLLGMTLAASGINIVHIDNFVYHEGLDTNEVFLAKIKQSIETLVDLYKQNKLPAKTKLIKLHSRLAKLKLNGLATSCINPWIPTIEKNLLSSTPSMFYMDLLKLWYFEVCLNR
ncbi:glycosyltransferase family 2 protein [Cytophaga aurantiaca]|uniref:glycosyltransferase family 2 protein n=1 Tax=Cytophaga aurantiaca TaxID=29530 RepID=UPI00035CFEA7|nr:glycosyltransferase family A protein [Cytophaga aurantiaca]